MGMKIIIGKTTIECTISKTVKVDLENIPLNSDILKKSKKRRLIPSDPKWTDWNDGKYNSGR
jgi:hypothetical protein